jgi:murein DD-endopeptidase MepM/ murein hydrolase activator NlpD
VSVRLLACLPLAALAAWLAGAIPAARADEVSERLVRLQARIAELERRARLPAGEQVGTEAASTEPEGTLRSQDLLRELKGEAESELVELDTERRQNDRRLELLRQAMGARLVVIYKRRRGGQLPALYSARDFQSRLRLASSLGRVISVDSRLFERYRRELAEQTARAGRSRALELRVADTELAYERQRRIDRRNFLELGRMRALRDQRLAGELRGVAKELEARARARPAREPAPLATLRRGRLLRPVAGPVRARFGTRLIPEFERVPLRTGIEIAAARGAWVRAVAPGRVIFAEPLRGYGSLVIIQHGGELVSVSGCLEQRTVSLGDLVEAGQIVGTVGDGAYEGAGLYFELRASGAPVDPETWLQ